MDKHMDKAILKQFLLDTIHELSMIHNFSIESDFNFQFTPNLEQNKNHNSIDDLMRLGMFLDDNIKGKVFDMDTTIKMHDVYDQS